MSASGARVRSRRAAWLSLIVSVSGTIALFFLWDGIDEWTGDILIILALLSLFAIAVRALL